MKRIVRLTESDLTRVVKRVISEMESTSQLPNWVKSDENLNGESVIYVDKNWFVSNRQKLEKNIKDYYLLYSRSQQLLLKNKNGYNPENDYISDDGTTFINGKVVGHNSSDKLQYRTNFGDKVYNDIMNNKRWIDLLDSVDLNFIEGIISDEEVNNIKNTLINKYGRSNVHAIYIEAR